MGIVVPTASAHVEYVVNHSASAQAQGTDWGYLWHAISEPYNQMLIIMTILVTVLIARIAYKCGLSEKIHRRMALAIDSYRQFFPLILRLGLGSTLIGMGMHGAFISPALEAPVHYVAWLQIVLGLAVLFGIATHAALLVVIMLYLFALSQSVYLIGNAEFLAVCLALLIIPHARPGLCDLLGMTLSHLPPERTKSSWLQKTYQRIRIQQKKCMPYASVVLRCGLGVSMVFLGLYEKILNPHMGALVVEQYELTQYIHVSPQMWVLAAGIIEIFIGICVLFGVYTRTTALVSLIVLTTTFFFFQENVASHATLFSVAIVLFIQGAQTWSLDTWIRRKRTTTSSQPISHTHRT